MSEPSKPTKGIKAWAEFVGGWTSLMSGGISVPFAIAVTVYQGAERRLLTILAFVTLAYFCFSLIRQLRALREKIIPKLKIECGERVTDSVSREWPVGPAAMPTSFFGFVLTNTGLEEIEECQAFITRVEKNGQTIWNKTIALSFEPHSRTEKEPVEKITLPNEIPRSVCLCSVDHTQQIMPGSMNQTSRYGTLFHRALSEFGDFTFFVSISSKGHRTKHESFVITWPGKRQTTAIKPYSSLP